MCIVVASQEVQVLYETIIICIPTHLHMHAHTCAHTTINLKIFIVNILLELRKLNKHKLKYVHITLFQHKNFQIYSISMHHTSCTCRPHVESQDVTDKLIAPTVLTAAGTAKEDMGRRGKHEFRPL